MNNFTSKLYDIVFYVLVLATLSSTSGVFCSDVGLAKKDAIVFEPNEQNALRGASAGLRLFSSVIPSLVEHYHAFHRSLHELDTLQDQSKGLPLDDGKDTEGSKDFETANERVQCQEIISRLRKSLPAGVFKGMHAQSGKFHSIIHKIVHARFAAEDPTFQSKVMHFLKMPKDQLDSRIEHFFTEFKTVKVLKQFLSELIVVLEGAKAHLPGGDKMLEKLVPPTAEELVNVPAVQGKK